MLSIPLSLITLRLPNICNWYHILHANVEMIDGKINIKGASYTQESFKTLIFLLIPNFLDYDFLDQHLRDLIGSRHKVTGP